MRWLWNYVARDFAGWPRLTYGKVLAGVVLWGLLFVLVLTMISGARELMTPGAWKKQGFTYKLAEAPDQTSDPSPASVRRQHLEQLRQALWPPGSGGALFAMADGSVRFVSERVSPTVLKALATPDGGEAVDPSVLQNP